MSSGKILKTLTGAMYVNGQIYEPQTIDRVIFLTGEDLQIDFKESCILDFPKYSKSGSTDFIDNLYVGTSNKIKININLVYQFINMDYSPRFSLEILKNDVIDKRRSMGMNDSSYEENAFNETFVINIMEGDKIQIQLTKNNDEINTLRIESNGFIEYSAF